MQNNNHIFIFLKYSIPYLSTYHPHIRVLRRQSVRIAAASYVSLGFRKHTQNMEKEWRSVTESLLQSDFFHFSITVYPTVADGLGNSSHISIHPEKFLPNFIIGQKILLLTKTGVIYHIYDICFLPVFLSLQEI